MQHIINDLLSHLEPPNRFMTILRLWAIRTLSTLLIGLLLSGVVAAEQVNVAVASNFITTLRQLADAFEQQSGHTLRISAASTGKLYAQIYHGAPFDIFLAADEARPTRLVQEGKAISSSRFTYALGQLAFWSPKNTTDDDAISLLKSGLIKRLAIANPKTAPYGLAAKSTLQKLELWQPSDIKRVRGENVGQTFHFIISGAVDGGFVALSQTRADKYKGLIWHVPTDYYAPIRQQVVLLKRAAKSGAALSFLSYLNSDDGRKIIRESGYAIEGEG
ncbi:MAG: molybdate ABC transporter substrate-binding protein [Candidatus Polarisedimenticolaceae bacterium]|nr:molybdate ABC transporter substrate-binding protein [Candidatus Polarisedimenticolaceae bacterium]